MFHVPTRTLAPSADILGYSDPNGEEIIDKILDKAGQKGTGKWTAIEALELGMPLTLIGESVFARCLSALKSDRVAASKIIQCPDAAPFSGDRAAFLEDLRQAMFCAKVVSYAQGFMMMQAAAKEHDWELNYGAIGDCQQPPAQPVSLS
jgi:6-phosphogluconate dehydrogenase